MRSCNLNLENDGFVGHVAIFDFDSQIGRRRQKLLIIKSNLIRPVTMIAPRLIVVSGIWTEGSQDSWQVVQVFQSHVLFNNANSRLKAVVR
jgi:hypothetical protein